MTLITLIVAAFALGVSLLLALLIVSGTNRLRRVRSKPAPSSPAGASMPAKLRAQGGREHQASAAAEVLESIIQRRMAADPTFNGQELDFGSSPDGSLEIWWKEQAYSSVDQLPDSRLRELINQAIEEFNRGDQSPG